jgi:DNA replication protein DnaC
MGLGTELKQAFDQLLPTTANQKPSVHGNEDRNYDHILLTEDETAEALRQAREQKHFLLKRLEYGQNLNKPREIPNATAEQVYDRYKEVYLVDDANQDVVWSLCFYFTNDARFKGDLNKGLLLFGGVGIGKTTLMHFFKRNPRATYKVISCRDIESDFSSEGEKSVRQCSTNIAIPENEFLQKEIGFCFDDLGTEATGKHYGKEKNVMAEILLNRYDNRLPFCFTHVTTNLSHEEVKDQYGIRAYDRFKEMFNIISFPTEAKSRRK